MQIQLSTKISTQMISTYLYYDIHGRWLVFLNQWRFPPPIPSITTQPACWRQIIWYILTMVNMDILVYIDNGNYGNDVLYNIQQDVDGNDDINANNDDAGDYSTI